jgi:hypothetical protein
MRAPHRGLHAQLHAPARPPLVAAANLAHALAALAALGEELRQSAEEARIEGTGYEHHHDGAASEALAGRAREGREARLSRVVAGARRKARARGSSAEGARVEIDGAHDLAVAHDHQACAQGGHGTRVAPEAREVLVAAAERRELAGAVEERRSLGELGLADAPHGRRGRSGRRLGLRGRRLLRGRVGVGLGRRGLRGDGVHPRGGSRRPCGCRAGRRLGEEREAPDRDGCVAAPAQRGPPPHSAIPTR